MQKYTYRELVVSALEKGREQRLSYSLQPPADAGVTTYGWVAVIFRGRWLI